MKSLYSELSKWLCRLWTPSHSLFHSHSGNNGRTYLFPFVSMGTWGNKDRFPIAYFLLLFSPPSPPTSFPPSFLLAREPTKVSFFFFLEGCLNIRLQYEKIHEIRKINKLASDVQQLNQQWASRILSFLPSPLPPSVFAECLLDVRE